ncbi:MAG: DUF2232 domain-containing protein, partial [Bacillota bacterium]|nr:DUF2232 domain-containing protein [Bacillota bacterium]
MKTRSLTEGAMLGALTVLLTLLGEYLGVPALIVPVPLTLLVYRQGFRWGIITAVVAALVTGMVAGHVFAGLSIIIWGFVGVAVGMALREKFSFPKLMGVGIFANLVVIGLNLLLYFLIIGGNMYTDLMNMFIQSIEQAMETSRSLGVPEEALANYQVMLELVPFMFRNGLPAMLLLSSVGMAFINLAVVRLILKRMGDTVAWIKPFTQWRLPGFFSILFFSGWTITVLAGVLTLPPWLEFIGVNLFFITSSAYIVTGISLAWYYFNQRGTPTFLRVLFVILLFTVQIVLMAVVLITVADSLFDLRKLAGQGGE